MSNLLPSISLHIAILAFNRTDYIKEVLYGILNASHIDKFHLNFFVDGPRNDSDEDKINELANILEQSRFSAATLSFNIHYSDINRGVWSNKIHAFEVLFNAGAELVLLVEDDVVIRNDALKFVIEAFNYIQPMKGIATISLYSTSLLAGGNATFSRALKFIELTPSVFSAWGARDWPFPWGIALTKRTFELLMEHGWSGNDQNMGVILRREKGFDIYPILTRSRHVGAFSSTHNSNIDLQEHVVVEYKTFDTFKISSDTSPLDAFQISTKFHNELLPDSGVEAIPQQVFYVEEDALNWYKDKFCKDFDVIPTKVDDDLYGQNALGIVDRHASRIKAGVVVLCFDSDELTMIYLERLALQPIKIICIDPSLLSKM
jgi:hypothetical protein